MLSLSPATRVFLALQPIDGRKGFNGLYSLVKDTLQQEPTSGFLCKSTWRWWPTTHVFSSCPG